MEEILREMKKELAHIEGRILIYLNIDNKEQTTALNAKKEVLKRYIAMIEGLTGKYTFFWLDGKRDVLEGNSVADALNKAGYGNGALAALDFHAKGDCDEYKWNSSNKQWDKK